MINFWHIKPSGKSMNNTKLMLLTLLISFLCNPSGILANDQRSKLSALSDATAEKLQQNKLNNHREIFIDDNDEDFEGSGRKGEVRDELTNENDDFDGSGSGYPGNDDDEDLPTSSKDKSHIIKQDQSSNTHHHSGDGFESSFGTEDEYTQENEKEIDQKGSDRPPHLHIKPEEDDFSFETNSTESDNTLSPSTTDDEDSGDTKRINPEYPGKGIDDSLHPTHHVPILPTENTGGSDNVLIMNTANEDRATSFFAQPGILAAVIGGAVVGLLFAILVVMFIVYRMRKKDEGSYALDEPQKRSPQANSYTKNHNNREFYA